MGSKVQGEGDYESARHYNDETRKFVDEKTGQKYTDKIESATSKTKDALGKVTDEGDDK